MENELYNKCRLLGIYSVLLASKTFWAFWSDKEDPPELKLLEEARDAIEMITTSLGFDISLGNLITKDRFDLDAPVTTLVYSCFTNNPIQPYLDEIYGSSAKFVYGLSQLTVMAGEVASFLSQLPLQDSIPSKRRKLRQEKHHGQDLIRQYGSFLRDNRPGISKFFPEIADAVDDLQSLLQNPQPTKKTYAIVKQKLDPIINSLAPEYGELSERLERVSQLTEALKGCKPGRANWRKYEQLGIQIARFLFVPPFKRVIEQSRTEAGDTRRDAVLPNNQYSGFWQMIREEFDSRHIVCEFKNYLTPPSKSELNQLRIYLDKPTVGRFGLLFIRRVPSSQLLTARRRAYEESQILILILNDELVGKMLKMRVFTGHPEEILENLKIQFELSY